MEDSLGRRSATNRQIAHWKPFGTSEGEKKDEIDSGREIYRIE
jgi:hypothetical protein